VILVPDWKGVLCLNCRAELDFGEDRNSLGVWFYRDYPECSLIQVWCRHCKQGCNIYLGEEWAEDVPYLSSIGLGCIEADNAPQSVLNGFREVFGYFPLGTYHLSEILFFAYLLANPYDEWWNEVSYEETDRPTRHAPPEVGETPTEEAA